MKSLVIGGTGFLGGEIVRQLLERGEKVRTLCRKVFDLPLNTEVVQGDITDRESLDNAFRGMDTVYHTASLPSITVDWQPYYETNVVGTQNVIDACKKNGVRKLIYTSSASVPFDCKPQLNVDESAPYPKKFFAHYPHSKALAEQNVLQNASPELLTCSIRPHLIIGERDRHLLPRLFRRAESGRLFRVGNGTNLVDIVFVENAALGHILAAEALTDEKSPVNGSVYFITQGEPVNCWDWINEVLAMKKLPKVKRSIPFSLAWNIGWCIEMCYKMFALKGEPVMTRFLAAELALPHYLNIAKAKRDFNYTPQLSMSDGMKKLAAAIQDGRL